MTRDKVIQRLQQLRGLFAAMERGEDPEGCTSALDHAIAGLSHEGVSVPVREGSEPRLSITLQQARRLHAAIVKDHGEHGGDHACTRCYADAIPCGFVCIKHILEDFTAPRLASVPDASQAQRHNPPTGGNRPIQDVSSPIPPDPAAPSMSSAAVTDAHADQPFRVGVNEADETDPHLRMQAAPASPSMGQAINTEYVPSSPSVEQARQRLQAATVQLSHDVTLDSEWAEWDRCRDALIAAVRAEQKE